MRLSVFPKYAARNSEPVMQALIQGFQRHGVTIETESSDSDAVIIWSQLWAGRMRHNRGVYQHYRTHGRPIVIVDAGCINRGHTWRISTDQHCFIAGSGHDAARLQEIGLMIDPWRHDRGSDILIALQRTDSNQWQGMPDIGTWLGSMIQEIRRHSDRPIRVRPHPRNNISREHINATIELPQHILGTYDDYDLLKSLDKAWCVINWNSSPGVIATLSGVPAFVGATSLAAPVANQDLAYLENPGMPDRSQWANDLAWTEWTVSEMQNGVPQSHVLPLIQHQ
jgi:hypothetical protein